MSCYVPFLDDLMDSSNLPKKQKILKLLTKTSCSDEQICSVTFCYKACYLITTTKHFTKDILSEIENFFESSISFNNKNAVAYKKYAQFLVNTENIRRELGIKFEDEAVISKFKKAIEYYDNDENAKIQLINSLAKFENRHNNDENDDNISNTNKTTKTPNNNDDNNNNKSETSLNESKTDDNIYRAPVSETVFNTCVSEEDVFGDESENDENEGFGEMKMELSNNQINDNTPSLPIATPITAMLEMNHKNSNNNNNNKSEKRSSVILAQSESLFEDNAGACADLKENSDDDDDDDNNNNNKNNKNNNKNNNNNNNRRISSSSDAPLLVNNESGKIGRRNSLQSNNRRKSRNRNRSSSSATLIDLKRSRSPPINK